MKLIREKIIEFFKDEDMKLFATSITKPITNYIYDEVYLYVWCFCIYQIFQIITIMIMIYLLLKILKSINKKNLYTYYNSSNYEL
jgi:hypothetical protein